MIVGKLALIFASFYTGFAIYIVFVEQPARLSLNNESLLSVWKIAYNRGHVMGLSTTLITGILGITSFIDYHQWFWLMGAIVILANAPYTIIFIRPTNNELLSTLPKLANNETRYLIQKWVKLHTVRCLFGITASLLFLASTTLGSI